MTLNNELKSYRSVIDITDSKRDYGIGLHQD